MLQAARQVAERLYRENGVRPHIAVTAAPGVEDSFYTPYLQGELPTRDTYATVANATAAVVNSGTATLETALLRCPQTAVYYIACSRWLEWLLRPILFHIPHFTLVNILSDNDIRSSQHGKQIIEKPKQVIEKPKQIIEELVASRFTEENVEHELYRLMTDAPYRQEIEDGYARIQSLLGTEYAAKTAADHIVRNLQ